LALHRKLQKITKMHKCIWLASVAWGWVLATLAYSVSASYFACGLKDDVVVSANQTLGYKNVFLTNRFGATIIYYQQEGTNKIKVKSISNSNDTFTVETEYDLAVGQLGGVAQSIDEALVVYRDQSNTIAGRYINIRTTDLSSVFNIFTAEESQDGFGAFLSPNVGFVAWGSSISKGVLSVKRQTTSFDSVPAFDSVGANATGNCLISATDTKGTMVFIMNSTSEHRAAVYVSSVQETFFVKQLVVSGGVVPFVEGAEVAALASSVPSAFMLVTTVLRDGSLALQSTHTFNSGGSWTDSLEVGSFTANPLATNPVTLVWVNRWIVMLNTNEGLKMIQMTDKYPFEFDWKDALRAPISLDFVDLAYRRTIALLPYRTRLMVAATDFDARGLPKISSSVCALYSPSSAVRSSSRFVCTVISVLLLLYVI